MDERARFEALLVVLDDLVDANERVPILVEGQRDVAALRALGCAGAVTPLHDGRPLWVVVEDAARAGREVILLTDWDRKGGIWLEQLALACRANGLSANVAYRERLRDAVSLKLKDVESLASYVENGLARFLRQSLDERRRGVASS